VRFFCFPTEEYFSLERRTSAEIPSLTFCKLGRTNNFLGECAFSFMNENKNEIGFELKKYKKEIMDYIVISYYPTRLINCFTFNSRLFPFEKSESLK